MRAGIRLLIIEKLRPASASFPKQSEPGQQEGRPVRLTLALSHNSGSRDRDAAILAGPGLLETGQPIDIDTSDDLI